MARRPDDLFYWDSSSFLSWLEPEPERMQQCGEVLHSAEKGECVIVTSSLTLAEVVKLEHHPPLKRAKQEKIRTFFENDYIEIRFLDRRLAEFARKLIWDHEVSPRHAVHVATAIKAGANELHTWDDELIELDGKLRTAGGEHLRICTPAARQRSIAMPQADADVPDE